MKLTSSNISHLEMCYCSIYLSSLYLTVRFCYFPHKDLTFFIRVIPGISTFVIVFIYFYYNIKKNSGITSVFLKHAIFIQHFKNIYTSELAISPALGRQKIHRSVLSKNVSSAHSVI